MRCPRGGRSWNSPATAGAQRGRKSPGLPSRRRPLPRCHERVRAITFTEHIITDDLSTKNPGNATFSEAHASTFADVDGDGIPDFIVGKRLHAHLESYTDPDSMGPPVLHWFRTVRNPKVPGGAEFIPELIHNRSGVGSTVLAVDLNKDGAMDIVTSTDRGTFIFWGKPGVKPRGSKASQR